MILFYVQELVADSPRPIVKTLCALPQARVESTTRSGTTDGGIPIGVYPRSGFASWIEPTEAKPRAGRLAQYGDWRMLDPDEWHRLEAQDGDFNTKPTKYL